MRTIFSSEEIAELQKNPCVFRCGERTIHYTYEFKRRALALYEQGISPDEIWRRAGFDVDKWKKRYCHYTIKDWKRLVKKGGLGRLAVPGGMPSDSGPRDERDRIKRLELQVVYLAAENDFLAKLRAKRAESSSGRVKNSES